MASSTRPPKDCPECSVPLKGKLKCMCGWEYATSKPTTPDDPVCSISGCGSRKIVHQRAQKYLDGDGKVRVKITAHYCANHTPPIFKSYAENMLDQLALGKTREEAEAFANEQEKKRLEYVDKVREGNEAWLKEKKYERKNEPTPIGDFTK